MNALLALLMPAISSGVVLTSSTSSAADISTFTTFGTSVLTWLITTFGTVLDFMLDNPICFIGLILSLLVTAVGMLRHIIGG